jgi:hypothetical protein
VSTEPRSVRAAPPIATSIERLDIYRAKQAHAPVFIFIQAARARGFGLPQPAPASA